MNNRPITIHLIADGRNLHNVRYTTDYLTAILELLESFNIPIDKVEYCTVYEGTPIHYHVRQDQLNDRVKHNHEMHNLRAGSQSGSTGGQS